MIVNDDKTRQKILKKYIPLKFKQFVEKNYYQKTNIISRIENLAYDESFFENPLSHIALYSDHGVMHVQNVAHSTISYLDEFNGVLFKKRNAKRLNWMKHFGALIAYLHDSGMCNCSDFGRSIHPEYIAQELFTEKFSKYIDILWNDKSAKHHLIITQLMKNLHLTIDHRVVLRELLAMTYCHSKSSVSAQLLNDPDQLKIKLQNVLKFSLEKQYMLKLRAKGMSINDDELNFKIKALEKERKNILKYYYVDYDKESFAWLRSDSNGMEIIEDIIDSIRILRAADALRQRGVTLKTSGSYPILLDPLQAKTIYSFFLETGENILLESHNDIGAGEASFKFADLTKDGHLEFGFYTGNFHSEKVAKEVARKIAIMVNDVQLDVIDSIEHEQFKLNSAMKIFLQEPPDNYAFADSIKSALIELNPNIRDRIEITPNLAIATESERQLYLAGEYLPHLDDEYISLFLTNLEKFGLKIKALDMEKAFKNVKKIVLKKDECLFKAYDPPEFAYISFDKGLMGKPAGGYEEFNIIPWVMIGHLGIISNTLRNATVYTTKSIELLMIPKSVYLRYWYKPYSTKEFLDLLKKMRK